MSQEILNKTEKFGGYKFEKHISAFVNQFGMEPDIDAMLEIMHILDEHRISYKIGGGFHIRVLNKK